MTAKKEPVQAGMVVHKREDLARSEKFRGCEDLVRALLDPDRDYTVMEAEEIIKQFRKKRVK